MNWKNYVVDLQRQTYRLPPGWDSREDIAAQLDCSPERVLDHLRPAIKSGAVEQGSFDVWDEKLGRRVRVTAYRKAPAKASPNPSPKPTPKLGHSPDDRAEIIAALRAEGRSWSQVGAALGVNKSSAMKAGRKAGVR
jgi:DNA-binding Lrp family transcriptional regulator